jgi:hypothetical protein
MVPSQYNNTVRIVFLYYKGREDGVQIREFQHSGKILFSVYTSVPDPDNLICESGSRNVKK